MTEQLLLDPNRKPSAAGVERAAAKVADILPKTPLLPLTVDGKTIWCKAECLQPIGAFKIRGGWHRLTDLDEEQRKSGVVAFSSGNHAQGVAWAARRLGIKAIIIMPADAPLAKLENTKKLGAEVITYDRLADSREELAAELAGKNGAVVVPSFDDPWIIEGQGSTGVEIREQMMKQAGGVPDHLVACCGGGGLATGMSLVNPEADITIVEPEGWDDMKRSLNGGSIVPVQDNPPETECDALQTLLVSPLTFDVLKARKATGLAVTKAEVHHAMRVAFEKLRLVVEPGGAVALAAILSGKAAVTDRTVITISGGNVDRDRFAAIIGA